MALPNPEKKIKPSSLLYRALEHGVGEGEEIPDYFKKYTELLELWQKQENYLDFKLKEIENKDRYAGFLMKTYEDQAKQIIQLNTNIRELSNTIEYLQEDIKELKTESAENRERCDCLEKECLRLRYKNKRLLEKLKKKSDSRDRKLDSTLSGSSDIINDAIEESTLSQNTAEGRNSPSLSSDFRDTGDSNCSDRSSTVSMDSKKSTEKEEIPAFFDIEAFDKDGTKIQLSYEDSDRGSNGSDVQGMCEQDQVDTLFSPRKSTSRLSWLNLFRSNKVEPIEPV